MDRIDGYVSRRISSRRKFLKTAAAVAISHAPLARGQKGTAPTGRILAYVGTYTKAVDGGANGKGIFVFEFDAKTGELLNPKLAAGIANPSWIAIHPSHKYLYAINEVADFEGAAGSVTAFAINPNGDLRVLNKVSSTGAGPAHMSIDATGKYVFVANYIGGCIAVLPIQSGGTLGSAVDTHHDVNSLGSLHANNAPQGSFAISGHDAPHAHMIAADPMNKFVFATDLGQDRIYIYRFDATTGKLTPSESASFVSLPSGDGPRHFVFHPNGRWFYSLQEESSTIVHFLFDPQLGSLTPVQTVSALPPGFAGTSFASEILISPDGRFLYSANRLHDSICVCSIDASGMLKPIGETSTLGDYPRHCKIEPAGNFLYVCNQRSDSITSFRINRETGLLSFTGKYTPVGSPAMIEFLT